MRMRQFVEPAFRHIAFGAITRQDFPRVPTPVGVERDPMTFDLNRQSAGVGRTTLVFLQILVFFQSGRCVSALIFLRTSRWPV